MEKMYKRAEFAKELGSVIVMVDLIVGWTANPVAVQLVPRQRHDSAMHRAGHGTYTRRNRTACRFALIAKWLRLAGVDHLHAGTARRQAGRRPAPTVQGYYNVCRETVNEVDCSGGCSIDRTGRTAQSVPVPPAASTRARCSVDRPVRDDVVLQFRRRPHRPSDGIQAGATANRVALEASCWRATKAVTSSTRAWIS